MRVTRSLSRFLVPSLTGLLFLVLLFPALGEEYSPEIQQAVEDIRREIAEEGYGFTVAPYPGIEQRYGKPGGFFIPENYRDLAPNRDFASREAAPLPSVFSWADYDGLTPIKDQGSCGSCWAFSMAGAVECALKLGLGATLDISEQWLVSCNPLSYGCDGGYFCFQFFTNYPGLDGEIGIVREKDFFYAQTDLPCSTSYPYKHVGLLEEYGNVGNSGPYDPEPRVEDLKRAIYEYGPISVGITSSAYLQLYSGGVFDVDDRNPTNHAVVLYGWDDSQGEVGVFFMRNSWGGSWGEKPSYSWGVGTGDEDGGYCRIEYGCSRVGDGAQYVGIDSGTTTPRYSQAKLPRQFADGGTAQNWKADEAVWEYQLPFSFPFYQEEYDRIWVASNGYVSFTAGSSLWDFTTENLKGVKMIAPLWGDLSTADDGKDIYLTESSDSVTIRWQATPAGIEESAVDIELILNSDGSFQFNYGGGDFLGAYPVVGFSRGDLSEYHLTDLSGRWNYHSDYPYYYGGTFVSGVNQRRRPRSRVFRPLLSGRNTVSGDYNGDGSSDIAFFRPQTGMWRVKGLTTVYFGGGQEEPVSADYDGDGTSEVAVFRASDGLWAVRNFTQAYFGQLGDTPAPGDYDGDGSDDLAFFRRSNGLWKVRSQTRFYFGTALDIPAPADYNGDGRTDAAFFRPLFGFWKVRGQGGFYFGDYGDIPVPGDYTGDGSALAACFTPSTGLWKVRGRTRVYFGGSGDLPVPLDYSGLDALRLGYFNPVKGLWKVRGVTRLYGGRVGDGPATR